MYVFVYHIEHISVEVKLCRKSDYKALAKKFYAHNRSVLNIRIALQKVVLKNLQ